MPQERRPRDPCRTLGERIEEPFGRLADGRRQGYELDAVRAIGGPVNLSPVCLDDGHDEPVEVAETKGGGVESGDTHDRPAARERETLDGGDPDAEPGERARPDGDRVAVHALERQVEAREKVVDGFEQGLGVMGALWRDPDEASKHAVVQEGHASMGTGRVHGEDSHRIHHLRWRRRREATASRYNARRTETMTTSTDRDGIHRLDRGAGRPETSGVAGAESARERTERAEKSTTPAMRQFHDIKRQVPDAVLFFRMGDFYEMFYDDALTVSRALELTLTSRQKDPTGAAIPMCGIPYHAADTYIGRLIRRGFKVAVCDQMEDARQAKGVVKRDLVRIVTPATYLHQGYLEAKEPSYLMAVAASRTGLGVALVDLSTGDFVALELEGEDRWQRLGETLTTYRPREVLHVAGSPLPASALDALGPDERPVPTERESYRFEHEAARSALVRQFRTLSLEGFGLEDRPLAVAAAGAALQYLEETQKGELEHITGIRYLEEADHLVLDPVTQRNLELTRSQTEGGRQGSLIAVLDRTETSMGARVLRSWLLRPLVRIDSIGKRLDAVEELAFETILRGKLREVLKSILDLERLLSRITLETAGPRDFVGLASSLSRVPQLRGLTADVRAELLVQLRSELDPLEDVRADIESTLVSEPPATLKDGGAVRGGVSAELDELRSLRTHGRETLARIETRERERTGIGSLKVRFNKVFGYYIEVTKSNLDAVPADYIRKQTLVGSERYVTPELKEYEEKILNAEERIQALERDIFSELNQRVRKQAARIRTTAQAIATLDVTAALAEVASTGNYTKPRLHTGYELEIKEGRHPVIEAMSPEPFVGNDVSLDEEHFLVVLTGPNMGGKSTYLRQTALIVLMAQMGSFVPAAEAKIPIVDRIFTRVGASDNLSRGRSTFMVEMQETAHILHHATRASLILLDEIGRGTATYDGLSLAWSVAEHIAREPRLKAKTIFATHYHELTDLAAEIAGVVNRHVSAKEWHDDIVFLRKVLEGGSDRSYGIHVARLAGLPPGVIRRAQELLVNLEKMEFDIEGRPRLTGESSTALDARQLSLFANDEERVVGELRRLDPDRMTPLEALQYLSDLKKRLG
jgi:DNA mismatch repair protein MutS